MKQSNQRVIRNPLLSRGIGPHLVLLISLGLPLFLLALLGIASRTTGSLAAIWPANALLLGLMIRSDRYNTALGWLTACAALTLADVVTGAPLLKTVLLTAGNLIGVAGGVLVAKHIPDRHYCPQQTHGMPGMLLVILAASLSAGYVGMVAYPALIGGSFWEGWLYWCVTELVNYIAFLPVVLTAPLIELKPLKHWHVRRGSITPLSLLPGLSVVALCVAGIFIDGPAALTIPVIALLWCSFSYSIFTTALLTLFFCIWTLMALSLGYLSLGTNLSGWNHLMSWRTGVSVIALVPIIVASYNLNRLRQLQHLQWAASHDTLTGAWNRGAFYEHLQTAAGSSSSRPLALLMMDLDHFKTINDQYGHTAGDKALRHFCDVVQHCIRDTDVLGRMGGEEFAVLLTDCPEDELAIIAERIRFTLKINPITLTDQSLVTICFSAGGALTNATEVDPDRLLEQADTALYKAKRNGRDRLVQYREADSPMNIAQS